MAGADTATSISAHKTVRRVRPHDLCPGCGGTKYTASKQCRQCFLGSVGSRMIACIKCGTETRKYPFRLSQAAYCSSECRTSDMVGSNNPNFKNVETNWKCAYCRKGFRKYTGNGKAPICCSVHCKAMLQKKHDTVTDKFRHARRVRNVRLRSARQGDNHHSQKEWRDLLALFNGQCAACGSSSNIHRDHVMPLSKGGSDSIDNIQPLCRRCNLTKGSKIQCQKP